MKLLKQIRKPRGLRAKFGLSLLGAGLLCTVLFYVLYLLLDSVIIRSFENPEFENRQRIQQVESLQSFLDTEDVGLENLKKLRKWEKHQPLLMMELYKGEELIYRSGDESVKEGLDNSQSFSADLTDDSVYIHEIQIEGVTVTAVIYSDFAYQYYVIGTAAAFGAVLILFVLLFLFSTGKLIRYICRLEKEVQILEGGNLEYEVSIQGNDELTDLARSMNRMRVSLLEQMNHEQELQQANRRLITEMSHDLRTPLTGLMLYTEILRFHRYDTEEELKEYLEKIDLKAQHLKQLSDHLFEYAQEGKKSQCREKRSFQEICRESLENMICELKARGFQVDTELQWRSYPVMTGKDSVERILENICSNIVKYAHPEAPVRIETSFSNTHCGLIFMNTIAEKTHSVDSSGVGIESIQNLMKELQGICTIEQTESVFEISVLFPIQFGIS